MIYGAYEQGFDLLGFSEHGITGKAWDQQPFIHPLYCYQVFTGNSRKPPACDEFAAITDGSAPLENGQARGKGMFCVTGANELNAVTLTKSHVNGYFLPSWLENLNPGFENGTFFGASHKVVANDIIGPEKDINMSTGKDLPLPQISYLKVDGHRISMKVGNTDYVQWIANGKPLARNDVNGDGVVTLDLDDFNTDEMLYVRCEVYNENGMTYSQAITLDRGAEPLEYKPDTGFKATMQKVGFMLLSTRIYVIFAKLIGLIVKAVGK